MRQHLKPVVRGTGGCVALLLAPSAFAGHGQATRCCRSQTRTCCCARTVGATKRCNGGAGAKGDVSLFWCNANVPLPWRRQLGQPGCASGCAGVGRIDRAPLRQPVPLPFRRGRRQQSQRYSPTALLQLPIVCATAAANPTDV